MARAEIRWTPLVHRKAVPFFLGIVLGEFVIGSFWSLLAVILDKPMYRFLF